VTFPIWQDGGARTIRYRTCGEPDCEVLADLEEALIERGDDDGHAATGTQQ
jgi:hypothetical protein